MLSVILGIFKLLGLLILIASGVFLLLLLLLLFVPFRYRGDGCYQERGGGAMEISWLWRFLCFRASYEDGPDAMLKLLCIPLWRFSEQSEKSGNTATDADKFDAAVNTSAEHGSEAVNTSDETNAGTNGQAFILLQGKPEDIELKGTIIQAAEPSAESSTAAAQQKDFSHFQTRNRKKNKKKKAPSFRSRIEQLISRIRALLHKAEEFRALFKDKRTQRLLSFFQRKAFRLGREIVPDSFRGAFRFGFDDPFLTGQLCSFAALLIPLYGDRLQLEPIFHQTAFSGEIHFRGKLRLIVPITIAAQTWFNKDFRYVRRQLRRISAEKSL